MRENYQHELFIETKRNTLANSLLMCFIGVFVYVCMVVCMFIVVSRAGGQTYRPTASQRKRQEILIPPPALDGLRCTGSCLFLLTHRLCCQSNSRFGGVVVAVATITIPKTTYTRLAM